jgi:hypothetical protein
MRVFDKVGMAIAVAIMSASAFADPPEGKGWKKHRGGDEAVSVGGSASVGGVLVTAGISISVARQIAMDSGVNFGSYQNLPPGIRKNLARGKPLPPGIAKKMAPQGMLGRLPQHPGYEWQVAGTDLILVQLGTAIVADVLRDVFH